MSTISEQGDDQALQKRIRQAVYDIRYKARKEEIDLRHAYSVYIGKSGLDQNGKEAVQNKLFGKQKEDAAESAVLESAEDNKYKVVHKDKETGKTYVRFAKRGKINKLRDKGSVEITGHGVPKGSKTSSTSAVKKSGGRKSLANLASNQRTLKKYKPTKITSRSKPIKDKPKTVIKTVEVEKKSEKKKPSLTDKVKKMLNKEDFLADAAAVAPLKNKKIGGEKVDNSKLIKVFPQDQSDPQTGTIKSSFKPVGEVVAEILAKETYTVTAADKKGNTPAWQGYKSGKKNVKTGKPLYKAADHLKNEEVVKEEGLVDPFYKSVPEEGDDGTGRSMYAKWNNVKNRLRSMGLKCNYELEGNELIEDAVEYFYEQGITEETIDAIVEEVGLDDFVEFVLDPHQDLVEERAARKAKANAPSYEKVKASVDASDAAKKKAGKGEYSKTYAKRSGETEDSTNYNDKPAAKKVAKKKAKPVVSSTKKAATKKKVTTVVKKVAKKDFDGDGKKESPKAEYKGSKDKAIKKAIAKKEGLRGKITSFVKKGVERHKKARAAGRVPEKRVKEFASGVKSGVKTAVKFAKDVKKVVSEEEERLRASGKFTEEEIEAILEASQYDELDNELLQIVEDNLGVKTEEEILELMESGWHRRNPGKKHPLESGSSKVTPRPVSDAEKKSTDKSDRMYVAMRRVKDRQQNYSKDKSDAADRLHGEYTSRQSKIKKGASPKEAAAQSHGSFGSKGFAIKRGGRKGKAPGTDRGTGNKAARRSGKEVKDTRKS